MAGERKGKTYEAIFKVVLDHLKNDGVFDGEIFWNAIPEGISVEPDFSVGADKDHPSIMFLVTHSNASMKSPIKCWRNLGELCEAKTTLVPMPLAINIIFDSVIRGSVKDIQSSAFDAQLIIGDKSYGQSVHQWASAHESLLPTNQDEKAAAIEALYFTDPQLTSIIDLICEDAKECILNPHSSGEQIWEYERLRSKKKAPECRITSVRRGISKLMVFDNIDVALRLYRGKRVKQSEIPEYVYVLNLAKKKIGGATPTDSEISAAVNMLSDKVIKEMYHSMDDMTLFQGWLYQARHIDYIPLMCNHVCENYEALICPEILLEQILQLHENPSALIDGEEKPDDWAPTDVWLITIIIEIIKANSGKANGYGDAQLARDVIDAGYGSDTDLTSASQFGGGFGFAAWMIRQPSPFKPELLNGIAHVLAQKLADIEYTNLTKLVKSHVVESIMTTNLIEAKICTYNQFKPLVMLIKQIPRCVETKYRTCFAEEAGLNGLSGTVFIIRIKHTLINWQSATDAGKDHKRKELSGKAVGLRYTWNAETERFEKRPGIEKLVLVLDGTWSQKDLDLLVKAGWDEIYYPDEIDKLKAAIV